MLADRLAEYPDTSPVVYWRGGEMRRSVLDVAWADTKALLGRVLVSYRSRNLLHDLISSDLMERGACAHLRTAVGHEVGLVRPTMMIDSFVGDRAVLLGREDNGALRDTVIVADLDHARRVLRGWADEELTDPRRWAAYVGERGASRAGLYLLEALIHPARSSAKTELEVAVRVEISNRIRRVHQAA